MTTSNTKAPTVVRDGYISEWKSKIYVDIINRELNKLSCLTVSFNKENHIIGVRFYKLMQKMFRIQTQQKKGKSVVLGSALCQKRSLIKSVNISRTYFKDNYITLNLIRSINYVIPVYICRQLSANYAVCASTKYDLYFVNILCEAFSIPSDFWIAQLNESIMKYTSYKNLKYSTDMVLCYWLLYNSVISATVLAQLLDKMFTRNSGRGQYRRIMLYFLALLKGSPMNKYTRNLYNLRVVLSVTGKFSMAGRTQKMTVLHKKLSLHTLSSVYDYAEIYSLTKTGVFSIKLWVWQS